MKIAFARFGGQVELNLSTGSIAMLGTEIRSGLLHDWIELGHDVNIVTEIKKQDKELLKIKDFWGGSSWLNKLENDPTKLNEADVLFIENGATNTMFAGKEGNFVEQSLKVMGKFNGKIVYYQHGHLPFPFDRFHEDDTIETTKEMNDMNMRKMFAIHFGTKEKLLEKDITILHHFQNKELFPKEFGYEKCSSSLKFKYLPLGYSEIDPTFEPKEKPKYDLIWVGGENDSNKGGGTKANSRASMIERFFMDVTYSTAVIGKWKDETKAKIKANWLGALGKHGDAYRFFNGAFCTMWGGSESTAKLGLVPTRPIMALRSGSLVIAQDNMYGVEDLIRKEFLVSNKYEAEKVIEEVKNMSVSKRKELCLEQLKNFPKWKEINWKEVLLE